MVQFQQRTPQVTSQHKVKDKETIIVILKSITKIDDEWVINLECSM